MCCFSNSLFFSLWLTQWHAGKMNLWPTWPEKKNHIKYTWCVVKLKKYTALPEINKKKNLLKQVLNLILPNITYLPMFVFAHFHVFVSSLTKRSRKLPSFFFLCVTVWGEYWKAIGERCLKAKLLLIHEMWCRVRPGVGFLFFFFLFFSNCLILSLLCNHIAKEWFQDLIHHYM